MRKETVHAAFFFVVLTTLLVLGFFVVLPVLDFVVMGFLLAVGFWPMHGYVQRAIPNRGLSALVTMLIASALVVVPTVLIALSLIEDLKLFLGEIDLGDIEGSIQAMVGASDGMAATLTGLVIPHMMTFLDGLMQDLAQLVARMVVGLMVLAFVLFYALAEGPQMLDRLRALLPLKRVYKEKLLIETKNSVNAIFFGQILISVLHGVALGFGFALFGLPNPVLWGFLTIIVSLLPVVGTPAVWLPAGLWVWFHDGSVLGVGLMLYGAVVSTGLIEHWVKLRVIGKMARIHPLVVLVGVIGGLAAFGMSGFLYGPLILALAVVFLRTFSATYEEDENYLFL